MERNVQADLEICNKAHHGPWWDSGDGAVWAPDGDQLAIFHDNAAHDATGEDNAKFCAMAREALPYWINEAVRLEAENARLRKVVEAARKIASDFPKSYSGDPAVGVYHYIANCMGLQFALAELDGQATEITLEHNGDKLTVSVDSLKAALTELDEGAKKEQPMFSKDCRECKHFDIYCDVTGSFINSNFTSCEAFEGTNGNEV